MTQKVFDQINFCSTLRKFSKFCSTTYSRWENLGSKWNWGIAGEGVLARTKAMARQVGSSLIGRLQISRGHTEKRVGKSPAQISSVGNTTSHAGVESDLLTRTSVWVTLGLQDYVQYSSIRNYGGFNGLKFQ